PGLPLGMLLPLDPLGRAATTADVNWTIPLGGRPEVTGDTFPQYFRVTIVACDCDANWDRSNATLAAAHHVSKSFDITVTNQKPAHQATVINTPVSYQLPALPNGHVASYTVTGLPAGLTCGAGCLTTGLITGTPTTPTTAPITVAVVIGDTVSGLSASTSFRW